MTAAGADYEGATWRLRCDGTCGDELVLQLQTATVEQAMAFLDSTCPKVLEDLALALGWVIVVPGDGARRSSHHCPACYALQAATLTGTIE